MRRSVYEFTLLNYICARFTLHLKYSYYYINSLFLINQHVNMTPRSSRLINSG